MRDEMRLTRMLIQYCDTKDQKVLDELKEWFAGMSEIQRACMTQSMKERRSREGPRNEFLFVPFLDFYNAISEYDIFIKYDTKFF